MLPCDTGEERELPGPTTIMTNAERATSCRFTATIPADPAAIAPVADGVAQALEARAWPEDDVLAVHLALQEALANAIRHGCGGDVTKYVYCSVTCSQSDEVLLIVRDPGQGFDPAAVADPLDPENRLNSNGRGIFLMRGLMDQVQFADGGREVRMRKRKGLDPGPPRSDAA